MEIRPRSKRRASRPATISSVAATVTRISVCGNRRRKQTQRLAETVDQRRGPGGEVKRTVVAGFVFAEVLLHPAHLVQDRARMFGQAEGVRGGGDLAARADEEFHPQIGAQGAQLLAHRSGAESHHFRRPGHAGRIHHRQEDTQLSEFHTI